MCSTLYPLLLSCFSPFARLNFSVKYLNMFILIVVGKCVVSVCVPFINPVYCFCKKHVFCLGFLVKFLNFFIAQVERMFVVSVCIHFLRRFFFCNKPVFHVRFFC
ncbi:hypothetical protein ACP275_02G083200 [Erythranthe tilingii]